MGKSFFDYDGGDYCCSISNNMALDSKGNLLMRVGSSMAMDMNSGQLHTISSWDSDDDDANRIGRHRSLCDDDDLIGRHRRLWDDDE